MRRRFVLPAVIFLAGLTLTFVTAWQLNKVEQQAAAARFSASAERARSAVESTYEIELALLRGTAGLFNASGDVSREEFRRYVERLRLGDAYPGVLGVGYAAYADSLGELNAKIAKAGSPEGVQLRHWPDQPHGGGVSAILYLEPLRRRNKAAIGYDMLSEATRREAMLRAKSTQRSAMSGRVLLVQEIDKAKQPGFLIYTPLRPSGGEFHGWVYSPLRGYDLFGKLFRGREFDEVGVAIYDGAPRAENLLFSSAEADKKGGPRLALPLTLGGRSLTIVTTDRSSGPASRLGIVVAVAGSLISLLLAALAFQQARTFARIERQVGERTAELRDANRKLTEEAAARSEAEEQLRQMQKLEAIGQLSGGIAHDFNNMLAVIIGSLDFARQSWDKPERLKRLIEQALNGASKAAELTQRLLAFSRRQTLRPSPIDANTLVGEMSELLGRVLGEQIALKTDLARDLWPTFVDSAQLENAILNLAVNARDAMPNGGRLTIETANCHLSGAEVPQVATADEREYVMIAVSDTGAGMPADVQDRAFEPFFTTKQVGKGTGLGLSQVFGFVRQSDGHVEIHSQVGEGTTVKLYLPRFRGPVEERSRSPDPQQAVPRGSPEELIMVVEDEADVRRMSVDTLRGLGYTVVHASNGADALDRLRGNPGVKLVFTDVVMPEMDGRELCEKIEEEWPDVRVLFTTGYAPNAVTQDGGFAPTVKLLTKPFRLEQLARAVRSALDA